MAPLLYIVSQRSLMDCKLMVCSKNFIWVIMLVKVCKKLNNGWHILYKASIGISFTWWCLPCFFSYLNKDTRDLLYPLSSHLHQQLWSFTNPKRRGTVSIEYLSFTKFSYTGDLAGVLLFLKTTILNKDVKPIAKKMEHFSQSCVIPRKTCAYYKNKRTVLIRTPLKVNVITYIF